MSRIGFVVPIWENKKLSDFTNEELLDYYYKLRLTCRPGELNAHSSRTERYVVDLQNEIISRMEVCPQCGLGVKI